MKNRAWGLLRHKVEKTEISATQIFGFFINTYTFAAALSNSTW